LEGTILAADEVADGWRVAEPGGGYQFEPCSQRVIGAAIAVHKELGPGFREELYENALCLEFDRRGLQYQRQLEIPVSYQGIQVGTHTLDLLVERALVVELKSVSILVDVHYAQLQAYLRAADVRAGLLLNFGELPLGIKRLVNNYTG
jgi:GxxExxY protein